MPVIEQDKTSQAQTVQRLHPRAGRERRARHLACRMPGRCATSSSSSARTSRPTACSRGNEASETGNVGEIPGLAQGATKTLRMTLKAGHYALICNMPGHYMAGQRVDFTVR